MLSMMLEEAADAEAVELKFETFKEALKRDLGIKQIWMEIHLDADMNFKASLHYFKNANPDSYFDAVSISYLHAGSRVGPTPTCWTTDMLDSSMVNLNYIVSDAPSREEACVAAMIMMMKPGTVLIFTGCPLDGNGSNREVNNYPLYAVVEITDDRVLSYLPLQMEEASEQLLYTVSEQMLSEQSFFEEERFFDDITFFEAQGEGDQAAC